LQKFPLDAKTAAYAAVFDLTGIVAAGMGLSPKAEVALNQSSA